MRIKKNIIKVVITILLLVNFSAGFKIDVLAYIQKEATIAEDTILRKENSNTSAQVMELKKGKEVIVNNEVTDTSGVIWYQLFVDGTNVGYVKTEMVTITANSGSDKPEKEPDIEDETIPPTTETIEVKVGKTGGVIVNMRADASTSTEVILALEPNSKVEVIGEKEGNDNFTWHQVKIEKDGQVLQGYIRSDLLEVTIEDREIEVEVPSEPTTENDNVTESNKEDPEAASQLYKLIEKSNEAGELEWFLKDIKTGKLYNINKVLNNSGTSTPVIIVLVLVIIALAAAVFFFALRYKNADEFIKELSKKINLDKYGKIQNKDTNKERETKEGSVRKQGSINNKTSNPNNPKDQANPSNTNKNNNQNNLGKSKGQGNLDNSANKTQPKTKVTTKQQPARNMANKDKTPTIDSPEVKVPIGLEEILENPKKLKASKPNSDVIINTTTKDIENRFQVDQGDSKKGKWKSNNFLVDDDDEFELDLFRNDDK